MAQQQQQQQYPQPDPQQTVKRIGEFYYYINNVIGKGSFAKVYKGFKVNSQNDSYALKVIDMQAIHQSSKKDSKLIQHLKSEIEIMKKCKHPNTVTLYNAYQTKSNIYLVMQWCGGGDLGQYLDRNGAISEIVTHRFAKQIRDGLHYLFSQNIIHRDFKPQNLLLSENSENAILRIADFGFARHFQSEDISDKYTILGTPLYMAPELLQCKPYNSKADLWSVGTIMFEMVAGKHPFAAKSYPQLWNRISKGDMEPYPSDFSANLKDLISGLLQRNPEKRMDWVTFVKHRWFDDKVELRPDSIKFSAILQPYVPYSEETERKLDQASQGPLDTSSLQPSSNIQQQQSNSHISVRRPSNPNSYVNPVPKPEYNPRPVAAPPLQNMHYHPSQQQQPLPQSQYPQQPSPYHDPVYPSQQPQVPRQDLHRDEQPYVESNMSRQQSRPEGVSGRPHVLRYKWQTVSPNGSTTDLSDPLCAKLDEMPLNTSVYFPVQKPIFMICRMTESTGKQIHLTTTTSTDLRRIKVGNIPSLEHHLMILNSVNPPQWWTPFRPNSDATQCIALDSSTELYRSITTKFNEESSMQNSIIVGIESVQNHRLWSSYQAQRSNFEKSLGELHLKEIFLWFCSTTDNLKYITNKGMSVSMFGESGQYGKGLYFSKDPLYSLQDNMLNNSGTFQSQLMLCRVVTGQSTVGIPDFKKPPSKYMSDAPYETMVDSLLNPSVYVVCNSDYQSYPEFLVTIQTTVQQPQQPQQPQFAQSYPSAAVPDPRPAAVQRHHSSDDKVISSAVSMKGNLSTVMTPKKWQCNKCDYWNEALCDSCMLCHASKPELPPFNSKGEWQCPQCTLLNHFQKDRCDVCQYPYGS